MSNNGKFSEKPKYQCVLNFWVHFMQLWHMVCKNRSIKNHIIWILHYKHYKIFFTFSTIKQYSELFTNNLVNIVYRPNFFLCQFFEAEKVSFSAQNSHFLSLPFFSTKERGQRDLLNILFFPFLHFFPYSLLGLLDL